MDIVQINTNDGISKEELFNILYVLESQWHPSMADDITNLHIYSEKIYDNAVVLGALINKKIVGIAAVYANDISSRCAYLTYIALLEEYSHVGIGSQLLIHVEGISSEKCMNKLMLEVDDNNVRAKTFYKKMGYVTSGIARQNHTFMVKRIGEKE